MKKNFLKISLILAVFLAVGFSGFAQQGTGVHVMALPYEEVHVKSDQPMPYPYIREADVMWSKIIWRKVELTEKMNHLLALPTEPAEGYKSLIDVLLDGIQNQGLNAYKASADDAGQEFDDWISVKEIVKIMGGGYDTVLNEVEEGWDTQIVYSPMQSSEIKSYLFKELWFFDKQRSVLDVRLIGICPIRVYDVYDNSGNKRTKVKKTFWVNYNEARPLLAKAPVYMPYTDVKAYTYDDLLQQRFFSSYIFMESTPYRRPISAYEQGLEVLLEAQRIENEIFNYEQDLWEY